MRQLEGRRHLGRPPRASPVLSNEGAREKHKIRAKDPRPRDGSAARWPPRAPRRGSSGSCSKEEHPRGRPAPRTIARSPRRLAPAERSVRPRLCHRRVHDRCTRPLPRRVSMARPAAWRRGGPREPGPVGIHALGDAIARNTATRRRFPASTTTTGGTAKNRAKDTKRKRPWFVRVAVAEMSRRQLGGAGARAGRGPSPARSSRGRRSQRQPSRRKGYGRRPESRRGGGLRPPDVQTRGGKAGGAIDEVLRTRFREN